MSAIKASLFTAAIVASSVFDFLSTSENAQAFKLEDDHRKLVIEDADIPVPAGSRRKTKDVMATHAVVSLAKIKSQNLVTLKAVAEGGNHDTYYRVNVEFYDATIPEEAKMLGSVEVWGYNPKRPNQLEIRGGVGLPKKERSSGDGNTSTGLYTDDTKQPVWTQAMVQRFIVNAMTVIAEQNPSLAKAMIEVWESQQVPEPEQVKEEDTVEQLAALDTEFAAP